MTSTEDRVRRSLKYSILDGACYSAMVGVGESFFAPFAILLGANNIQLGLLGTLPQVLGSLSQFVSNALLKLLSSRKRLVCLNALLEGLMYVPIALVYFLGSFRVWWLIGLVSLYWVFGLILSPAWNSWMGDLVGEKERGFYFGRRNRITGFASFFSLLAGGLILQRFAAGPAVRYLGFTVIFALALLARTISFLFLTKKYEPPFRVHPESQFGFIEFLRQARFDNYGLFVLYLSSMNFAVYLAVPFFAPYMLKDLGLDYLGFTVVNATALIVKYVLMPFWGRASDRYGAKKILGLTGFLMPLAPALWLVSGRLPYLIAIQAYSGFAWAGFEISSFNFIFDTTTPQKRATCIAYYNVLNGVSLLFGGLLGGVLVRYNNLFGSKYLLVFLLSSLMRYAVSVVYVPKVKEVREVEHISYRKLVYRIVSVMPTVGLIYHLVTLKKKKMPRSS